MVQTLTVSRSREGAWIEIINDGVRVNSIQVAPVRERGLKYRMHKYILLGTLCRSREGAWIEIYLYGSSTYTLFRRSREGAWIEMLNPDEPSEEPNVAPVRERGLK